MEKYINKIINADCMDILKQLPDKCIDLVLTDPPYNIAIAKWDKWKRQEDYINWLGGVFKECQRVLKDNGSFYFFHNDFLQIVELQNYINKNTDFIFKQLLVWDKFNNTKWNQLNSVVYSQENRNYSKQAEYCLYYTFQDETGLETIKRIMPNPFAQYLKDELITYFGSVANFRKFVRNEMLLDVAMVNRWFDGDCLMTKEKYMFIREKTGKLRREYEDLRREYEKNRYTFNPQGYSSVLNYPAQSQNEHITPKPIKLLENLIKHSSNENDLILDCFSGGGTTAIACHNLNRRFICIEKDYDYWKASEERLNNAQAQLKLAL